MDEQGFAQLRYEQLGTELAPHKAAMGQAADAIVDQDVSSYPIFVVHQHQVDIGIAIVSKGVEDALWSINATTLEELATKNIVDMERVDRFKEVYKDHRQFLCLFVLSELGANFIFLPRSNT